MRRLVIATRNPGKAKEIERILSGAEFKFMSLRDYPPTPEPEENADTFAGNASIKALAAADQTGELALADDSGLMIDALDGAPGVYSSRFAGEGATDQQRYEKVLDLMKDVPDDKRTARFVAVVAIAEPGKVLGTVQGVCEGSITHEPRGANGFGYDPVFHVSGFCRTMAELSDEEKDEVSHRGKALEKAKELLKELAR